MILLDAYALVAFLADEPAATPVAVLLGEREVGITAANLAEAAERLERLHEIKVDETREAVADLTQVTVVPIDEAIAWRAARIRASRYHRTDCPLSLADCLLIAATRADDRLASSDPHVLDVARADRRAVVTLPERR